ncbi:MAG TPA: VCBS repeat-containing protein, partial [Archangium sp.]
LFWASGDELVIRRNRGGWVFSQSTVPAGPGTRRSLALGDADGDQDLDVALTLTTGPESTTTRLFLNRVR